MIIDATQVNLREADLVIVGSGPAGITLATQLEDTGRQIVVLEAGGLTYDSKVQRLFEGSYAGDPFPPLRDTRLAAFGGSSGLWAGFCRPLEPEDFAPRHGSPGWPLTSQDLEPFWQRAHAVCGLAEYDYSPEHWAEQMGFPLLVPSAGPVCSLLFHVNAIRFGLAYRERLAASRNVTVALNAVVARVEMSRDALRVQGVRVRDSAGAEFELRTDCTVLAAGGIENARLLLLSGARPEEAPGNGSGLVGRFFTDHPFIEPGYLELNEPAALHHYFPHAARAGAPMPQVRGALSLSPRLREHDGLLSGAILILPRYEAHDVFATAEVKLMLEAFARLSGKSVPGGAIGEFARALARPGAVMTALLRKLLVRQGPARRWRLRMMFETQSRYENRVTLEDTQDSSGRPRARLEWNLSPHDVESMRRFTELASLGLDEAGIGRIVRSLPDDPASWRGALIGGKHHMGTTRMHRDSAHGVVDADCRVHGTTNLFIAGSSVFPSGGFANPTLTIVALALRLADHLRWQQERANGDSNGR